MKLRVYIAAPLGEASRVNDFAQELRALPGCETVSTWHWQVVLQSDRIDPSDPAVRRTILYSSLSELNEANLVVALTGLGVPRATYGEIAWALANGLPVIWAVRRDGSGANIFTAHDNVTLVHSREEALAAVRKFLEMP